jgi:hypothetical protein
MLVSRFVFIAVIGLSTVVCFGQTPPSEGQSASGPANGPRDSNQNSVVRPSQSRGQTQDQTGKPADSSANSTQNSNQNPPALPPGPEIIDDPNATPEQKASAEYAGPAVLSRGISASEPMNPKNIRFTPTAGLEYVYNSGITGVVPQNGKFSDDASSGVQVSYGLIGEKVYKKDTVSLGFHGSVYHYAKDSSRDGSDNELAFTWRHRLSRHLSFGVRESMMEYNRNNLLLSGSQLVNSGLGTTLVTATPTTEAFDGRVITNLLEGNVTWQINSRLSLNLSGGGFFTNRASTVLYGDTGYQAGADVAYRITRHVTAGAYYTYTHFDYTNIYGSSDVNTVGVTYSIAFNPTTQLITRIGGSRLETTGLQQVSLDPVTAALFGTSGTIEAVYLKNYAPDIQVQLRRKVSNLNMSLDYTRGITPGNGVILTSVRQSIAYGVDFKARRQWHFTATSGYDTLGGYGATNAKYNSVFVSGSVARELHRHLDWHTRVDYHHYTFDNTGFLRNSLVLSSGLVWTPGDLLERLW